MVEFYRICGYEGSIALVIWLPWISKFNDLKKFGRVDIMMNRRGFVAKSAAAFGGLALVTGSASKANAGWFFSSCGSSCGTSCGSVSSCSSISSVECCAPEPTCCAPEPTCCAPEPTCCAPEPSCCAPEPACSSGGCGTVIESVPVETAPAAPAAPAPEPAPAPSAFYSRPRYHRVSSRVLRFLER